MTTLTRLYRSQRALIVGSVAAAVVWGAAAAVSTWHALGSRPWAAVVATVAIAIALWWRRAVFEADRVALWLEERHPELQYTLITAVDTAAGGHRPELERQTESVGFERTAYRAAARLIVLPVLVAGAVVVGLIAARQLTDAGPNGLLTQDKTEPATDAPIRLAVTVTPPPHTRLGSSGFRTRFGWPALAAVGLPSRDHSQLTNSAYRPRAGH